MKNLIAMIVGPCIFILPMLSHAQDYYSYYYTDHYGPGYDSMNGDYSSIDYNYNNPHYYGNMDGGYKGFNGYIRFGRSFDNTENFSSGISSYQGTSTGPGPNGGYPGSPRGIYPTNYLDTSIYPNSYMRIYSR